MEFSTWYPANYEDRISGRYLHLEHINPLLQGYEKDFEISVVGTSEQGKNISCVKIGNGKKVILSWSQMHGNEATTTKSIFDFFKFISQKNHFQNEINSFLETYTFYCIPILNPDGAEKYTRENANNIDLNRDAKNLSQSESRCLRTLFDRLKPDLCLNLHDQRTMYSLPNNLPATVSFLAPAANKERLITHSRKIAMGKIAQMSDVLSAIIPGQIGRYDDTFNDNCVGDTFQMNAVPTILFEAGHAPGDYQREKTREYIFYALLSVLDIKKQESGLTNYENYLLIPENGKKFKDVIIRNVQLDDISELKSVGIQFEERLENNQIIFAPIIEEIGSLVECLGHREIDAKGAKILLNSHENVFVGANVLTIIDKVTKKPLFFQQ